MINLFGKYSMCNNPHSNQNDWPMILMCIPPISILVTRTCRIAVELRNSRITEYITLALPHSRDLVMMFPLQVEDSCSYRLGGAYSFNKLQQPRQKATASILKFQLQASVHVLTTSDLSEDSIYSSEGFWHHNLKSKFWSSRRSLLLTSCIDFVYNKTEDCHSNVATSCENCLSSFQHHFRRWMHNSHMHCIFISGHLLWLAIWTFILPN